jgi:Raf kinase inhibitor-like YbhB/YbcL family protein
MKKLAGVALAALFATQASAMELKSPDIRDGAPMAKTQISPRCGGDNVAPVLTWSGEPKGTRGFALTMIDLTARPPTGWAHWIVVDLPASVHSLPAGGALPEGAHAVPASAGGTTYFGPCPPQGTGVHQYLFTIYALPGAAPALTPRGDPRETAATLAAAASAKATLTGTAETPGVPGAPPETR